MEHSIIFNLLIAGVDALTSDFAFGALLAVKAAIHITSGLVLGVRGRPLVSVDQELVPGSRETDPLAITLSLVQSVFLSTREAREKAGEGFYDDIRHCSPSPLVRAPTPPAVALEAVVVPASMAVHRDGVSSPEREPNERW